MNLIETRVHELPAVVDGQLVPKQLKKITTQRDKNGNLSFNVVEEPHAILDTLKSLNARLALLEARPATLDISAIADAYKGVWSQAEYGKGSICTHKGSLWLAMADTSDQPDRAPDAWKMIMRKPRHGRDGKHIRQ
jgi:hypothetical protein